MGVADRRRHATPLAVVMLAREGGGVLSATQTVSPSGIGGSPTKRARQNAAGMRVARSLVAAGQGGRATAPEGLNPEPQPTLKTNVGISFKVEPSEAKV